MAADVLFDWDRRELGRLTHLLAELSGVTAGGALVRAMDKAGSDAARSMRTDSGRKVREKKRMKAGTVSRGLPLTFPTDRSKLSSLVWRMQVSGKVVPIASYPARQVKGGVSVEINKGRPTLIRSAFITTLRSGRRGVFLHKGGKTSRVQELYTSRIADVFNDTGFVAAVQERAQGVFASAFARLLPIEINKVR